MNELEDLEEIVNPSIQIIPSYVNHAFIVCDIIEDPANQKMRSLVLKLPENEIQLDL